MLLFKNCHFNFEKKKSVVHRIIRTFLNIAIILEYKARIAFIGMLVWHATLETSDRNEKVIKKFCQKLSVFKKS